MPGNRALHKDPNSLMPLVRNRDHEDIPRHYCGALRKLIYLEAFFLNNKVPAKAAPLPTVSGLHEKNTVLTGAQAPH